jgi:hypothetical protein
MELPTITNIEMENMENMENIDMSKITEDDLQLNNQIFNFVINNFETNIDLITNENIKKIYDRHISLTIIDKVDGDICPISLKNDIRYITKCSHCFSKQILFIRGGSCPICRTEIFSSHLDLKKALELELSDEFSNSYYNPSYLSFFTQFTTYYDPESVRQASETYNFIVLSFCHEEEKEEEEEQQQQQQQQQDHDNIVNCYIIYYLNINIIYYCI